MKMIVKLAAAALAILMAVSLSACHPANEIAMKFGDVEITSAMYMYELMAADSEGRGKVDEAKSGEEDASSVDYYKQKIDGTDFSAWVRNRAEELCRIYAAEELRFAELKLTEEESKISEYEYMAAVYWNYYGYQTHYEKNGISFDTFKKMLMHNIKSEALFEYYYGEKGTSRLSDDEMKEILKKNYIVVDEISESTSSLDEAAVTELKTKLEGYKTRLEAGESFAAIKAEHNKTDASADTGATDTSSDTSSVTATSSEAESTSDEQNKDDTPKPLDADATVILSEDAGGSDKDFETISAMKAGEVKIIENTDSKTLRLIVRKDVLADPYYYTTYFTSAAYLEKNADYSKDLLDYGKSLESSINGYAVNQFSPKKINRG